MNLSAIVNDFDTNSNTLSDSYEDDRPVKRRKLSHATTYQYHEIDLLSSSAPHLNFTQRSLGNGGPHTIVAHHDTTITIRDRYIPASPNRFQASNDCGPSCTINVELFSYSQSVVARTGSEKCEDYGHSGIVEELAHDFEAVTHCEEDEVLTEDIEGHICYGMLCNIDVEGCTVKKRGRFAVTLNETCSLQLAYDGHMAGQLSQLTQAILNTLVSEAGIRCQFWLHCGPKDTQSKSRNMYGRQQSETDYQHTLSAILYGPESLANDLGDWLNEVGMFLQQPEDCDCNVLYKNPQCLSFGQGRSVMTSVFATVDPTTRSKDEATAAGDLAELYTDNVYPEAPQPSLIRTSLHNHQKQALTFMLGREGGWCYDGSRSDIWQHATDSFGRIRFKNMISGHTQRHPPNDFRGGILADDMGLGKTCVMLSLIAADSAVSVSRDTPAPASSILGLTSATLIVVPFSLLQVWEKQIQIHFWPNKIRYLVYHDLTRQIRLYLNFRDYDIVISTYNTVASERKSSRKDTPGKGLFSIHWRRLILDEAHVIRTWTTANAKSVCDLEADCRWAVTGTPIQNRLSDIYSILKFLRVYPYENLKSFDDEILKPWKFNADQNALHKLQYLMKSIAIRRPKKTLSLPELQSIDRHLYLDPNERSVYECVRDNTMDVINSAISQQQQNRASFINAFQRLNDLRYICNHGRAPTKRWKGVPHSRDTVANDAILAEELDFLLGDTGLICVHCGVDIQDQQEEFQSRLSNPASKGNRSLKVCRNCEAEAGYTSETMSSYSSVSSPRAADTEVLSSPSSTIGTVYSSKMSALVHEVLTLPDNDKCVIFSYWTATLEVIGQALKDVGVVACQFDGRLSRAKRNQTLHSFSTDPNTRVLLISITCGGAGLDLTCANHAFLVEPQWNPQLEEQAMARVHRLGQTKPVRLVRFIVKDTWEEKIRQLQERKRSLADLIVDRKSIQDGDAGRKQLYYLRELLSNK